MEICFSSLWGLVSDDGWNDVDANVVCQQLGFFDGNITVSIYIIIIIIMFISAGAEAKIGSFYGKPNKTVHLTNIYCTGAELSLGDCTYYKLPISRPDAYSVAGVNCSLPPPVLTTSQSVVVVPTMDRQEQDNTENSLYLSIGIFAVLTVVSLFSVIW